MHHTLRASIFAAAIVAALGCGGITNEEAAKKFADRVAMVCADEADGSRWVVAHHVGNVYTVKPLTK